MPTTIDDVAAWTRERFRLPASCVVMAAEVAGTLPGLPPRFTVIVFWTGALAQRHHLKVFKPLAQVTPEDLPPYWLRDALAVPPGFFCDCC